MRLSWVKAGQSAPASRSRLLRVFSIANLIGLVLLWPVEAFIAERHWLTVLITYMPQHLFCLPAVLLLAASLLKRDRRMLAANGAALAFFAFALLGFNIPLGAKPAASSLRVRVMSYNIHQGSRGMRNVANVVERHHPDILCLQEVNSWGEWGDPVSKLQQLMPGWHVARDGGLAVLSRHPITHSRVHYLGLGTGRAVFEAGVLVGGRRLTVLNTHFVVAAGAESLSRHRGTLRGYLRGTGATRLAQKTRLLDVAGSAQGPVVITGDFNTPPRGLTYRRITARFTDAFRAAGWGTGHTYRARLSVLRIDYVFTPPEVEVMKCWAPCETASDHRPVIADIALK